MKKKNKENKASLSRTNCETAYAFVFQSGTRSG